MHLSALYLYPVKSCAGIAVDEWDVDALGFRYDRRWMVATPRGQFLTQRELPALARVKVRIAPPHLRVTAPGRPELITPLEPLGGRPIAVNVWRDAVRAIAPDHQADSWFSDYLGYEVIFAYMPEDVIREVDRHYAPEGGRTGFADGFPFLLIGEASLAHLSARLERPLPINRFRPNLVVSGSAPFGEDGWKRLRVGGIPMAVVKPCARCVVTTTDQETLERGKEPLRTLATFRKRGDAVLFGQNVVHYGVGRLATGMPVEIEA